VSVRLAHLSDIHFGGENPLAVEAALTEVRDFAPDLVVVTGDLTLNGLPTEFEAARRWLARLPGPQLVTPGNHDTPYWNLPLRAMVPFDRFRRYIGPPGRAAFDGPGLTARALNSARGAQLRPDWSKGAINIARLSDALCGMQDDPTALRVFACHHPLVDPVGAPVSGGVRRGAAAATALAQGEVDLVLTGHVHNPFAVALPYGDYHTYAVGAGTLSLRTRGSPAGLSLLTAEPDCVRVVALGWADPRFEPIHSWTLPRRIRGAARSGDGEVSGPEAPNSEVAGGTLPLDGDFLK